MYVCVYMYVMVPTEARDVGSSWSCVLQGVVSQLKWVLGPELRFFAKTLPALNAEPPFQLLLFRKYKKLCTRLEFQQNFGQFYFQ